MPEQITLYNDTSRISPFCHRVEIALAEAGATYTACRFDIFNKPAWFTQVNPLSEKIPVIAYGGPNVPPEEPSALSTKITESLVILEFLADLFPESTLLPPASDPVGRARVRFFIDAFVRYVESAAFEVFRGMPEGFEKLVQGLEKFQGLLPDPNATNGGEYATGRNFTNADCAVVPFLAYIELSPKTGLGMSGPEVGKKLDETLAGPKFDRLRRYKKVLFERESVKKVIDLEHMESMINARNRSQG